MHLQKLHNTMVEIQGNRDEEGLLRKAPGVVHSVKEHFALESREGLHLAEEAERAKAMCEKTMLRYSFPTFPSQDWLINSPKNLQELAKSFLNVPDADHAHIWRQAMASLEGKDFYDEKERPYLESTLAQIVVQLTLLSEEFQNRSDTLRETNEWVQENHPLYCVFMGCMDGRVSYMLMAGTPGKSHAFYNRRGIWDDFLREDGSLNKQSAFVKDLIQLKKQKGSLFLLLDSHLRCAAAECQYPGCDKGLWSNIEEKVGVMQELAEYIDEVTEYEKPGLPPTRIINTTYDPELRTVYFGLDTEQNRQSAGEEGYTPETLKQLTQEGRIISSLHLLENPTIPAMAELKDFIAEAYNGFRMAGQRYDWIYNAVATHNFHWWLINEIKQDKELWPKVDEVSFGMLSKVYHKDKRYAFLGTDADARTEMYSHILSSMINAFCICKGGRYDLEKGLAPTNPHTRHKEAVAVISDNPWPGLNQCLKLDINNFTDECVHLIFAVMKAEVEKEDYDINNSTHSLNTTGIRLEKESFLHYRVPLLISKHVSVSQKEFDLSIRPQLERLEGIDMSMTPEQFEHRLLQRCPDLVANEELENVRNILRAMRSLHAALNKLEQYYRPDASGKLGYTIDRYVPLPMLVDDTNRPLYIFKALNKKRYKEA